MRTKTAEESDSLIVPRKAVMTLEGRGGQQEASADETSGTGDQEDMMENEKAEIARLAEKYGRVQSLMQYVNKKTLTESYRSQPKKKAAGVDGVTKEQYGERLNENLEDLIARMKRFSYRPYPVRKAYIPKANGKMRGLGIPTFEDKVVQGVFKEILEAIYEPKSWTSPLASAQAGAAMMRYSV